MSLPPNWRQLKLFEALTIRDPNFKTDDALYSNPSLSSITATSNYMVLSVNDCFLKVVSKDFVTLRSFMAHEADYRISFIKSLPNSDLLVSIAEKQGYPSVLKLWDLNKIIHLEADMDFDSIKTKYQTQVLIQNGDNAFPISCYTFNREFNCIAIGYTNGKVLLIRGDFLRDRGSKQRLIYESADPITNIYFNEFHELLYITTTSRILTVATNGRNQGKPLKILSKKVGVPLQCASINDSDQELIVGVDSSIRYYNQISKSHTINFEIYKKIIHRFTKDYLVMISPIEESNKLSTRVLIIDLYHKHISFNLTIPNTTINHVFEMWGDLYVLSSDGVLYKLHEKPINQQVELILQRELFSLAYQLAKQAKLPQETLLRICRLHGDYLYDLQDYDESIRLFIKCLKYFKSLENNDGIDDFIMHIITKFKDASNIKNLTEFLHQLYKLNIANNDHITLLLCCYCKLKLVDKIEAFIEEIDLTNTEEYNFANLDFSLIINLFRECGYFTHVIKLLFKLNQPNLIIEILLDDLRNPRGCLDYIKSLSIDDLLLILIDYSKSLLDYLPIETTELLINVFTGKYVPEGYDVLETKETKNGEAKNGEVKNGDAKNGEANGFKSDSNGLGEEYSALNSYKSFLAYISGGSVDDDQATLASNSNSTSEPTYLPPRPNLIFPSFINHPNEFVIFLEACIETFEKYQGSVADKKEVLITLYEMYLSLASKESSEEWLRRARNLLDSEFDLLDKPELLLISHVYGFTEGELVSKKEEGYEENLFLMAQLDEDVDECFDIVHQYGDDNPELLKSLLHFVVSKKSVFDKVSTKDFGFLINKLKELKLITPLELMQILGSTEFATIGLIRDYLIDIIDVANQEIHNNEKLIEHYEKESTQNSLKLTELKSKPFIIQNNKCSACNLNLDFPVVHFKCKHSFHQRCLDDTFLPSEDSANAAPLCSICINDIDLVKTLRDDQLKSKEEVDLFALTLKESNDKFKVIGNYLGKGVMESEFVQLNLDDV